MGRYARFWPKRTPHGPRISRSTPFLLALAHFRPFSITRPSLTRPVFALAQIANGTIDEFTLQQGINDGCVLDGPWALYSVSVYWAVMTITSIGYGDIHATDKNITEQVVNTLLMLTGAIIWGNLIGTFCGVVATMNPHQKEFNRRMDDLNRYVAMYDLKPDLRRRLREYLHQTRHLQVAEASKDLLNLLSPALQGEVTWAVNQKWLTRVSFFAEAEQEFLVQISLSLTALVFTPGELAINGYLYIVHRGMALYGGRVLTSGKVWGEDCIIATAHLQRRWCARAMNYLEVYMLSRDRIIMVAQDFPKSFGHIRRVAMRMAMRRHFILAAKMLASQQGIVLGSQKGSRTFDRLLEQATSVPMAELRLQASVTSNKLGVHAQYEGGEPSPLLMSGGGGAFSEEAAGLVGGEGNGAGGSGTGSHERTPPMLTTYGRPSKELMGESGKMKLPGAMLSSPNKPRQEELNAVTSILKQKAVSDQHSMRNLNAGGGGDISRETANELLKQNEDSTNELRGKLDALAPKVAALQEGLAKVLDKLGSQ